MKNLYFVILSFSLVVLNGWTFEIRSRPDQPHESVLRPGGSLYVATFEIVTGEEDLYGDGTVGGIFSYFPSTTNSSPLWGQWVWSTDFVGANGDQGYNFTMTDGRLEGAWLFLGTNLVFSRYTTNIVYVGLGLDYGVDWQSGDRITFVSSNFCRLKNVNGEYVYANGMVSNTVTLMTNSVLSAQRSGDDLIIQGSVPTRYKDYRLQESSDFINWSTVYGSDNLDRTIYEGKFYLIVPLNKKTQAQFFRLVPKG